jgi:hypothetical protein
VAEVAVLKVGQKKNEVVSDKNQLVKDLMS